jgi:hypothetical protein
MEMTMSQQSPVGQVLPMPGRGTGVTEDARSIEWPDVVRRLRSGGFRWLTSLGPDGQPHTRPVFAAWSESVLFTASNGTARKSRNLDADGRCSIATDVDGAHVVVEGVASRVTDEQTLRHASAAFEDVYGWPTRVAGDELDADYGAPTSGGPPYRIYQITPTKVYAFPAGGDFYPTRWTF